MPTPVATEKARPARHRGFTLVEATFALLIALVVSAGLASAVAYAVKSNRGATVRSLANAELRRHAEALQHTPFSAIETAVANSGGASKVVTVDGAAFTVVTTVQPSPAPPATPTVKTVTVTVTPQAGSQPGWSNSPVSVTFRRTTLKAGRYSKQ